VLAVIGVTVLAACTGERTPPPPPTTSTATAAATTTTSTTSTTTTTLPPTTTTMPGADVVALTCDQLITTPWPGRRDVVAGQAQAFQAAGGAGELGDAVRVACPDALARLEAAIDIEQRAIAAAESGHGRDDLLHNFDCPGETAEVDATNWSTDPIGLVAGARFDDGLLGVDEDADIDPEDVAIVIWAIPPMATQHLSIPLTQPSEGCSLHAHFFLGDQGPADTADTAGAGAPGPATTGDDPAAWLPELIKAELAALPAPTFEARADVEDVRWLRGSQELVEPDTDVHPLLAVTICPGTFEQPTPDHVAFAYAAEFDEAIVPSPIGTLSHPAYSTLEFGAFRRGSDGRWRRLTAAMPLTGLATGADCGPVRPHP
jgi:hypothetical protein